MPTTADAITDVRLIFYHPAVDLHFPNAGDNEAPANTLEVRTGANSIKWGYQLNTSKIPTYAGEVVQILSANVSAVRISGNSMSNFQLMSIYKWFRAYMQIAGARSHNQTPIKFQYPERGWELGLYLSQIPQVRLAVDQVAGEWSIVAEVNQDDVPAIEEAIMGQYNYSMPQGLAQMSKNAIVPRGVGFLSLNPFSQYLPPNTQIDGKQLDAWVGGKITATANTIGNSFEALIASWSAGDFLNFAFDVGTGAGAPVQTPDQIWAKLFGSNVIGGSGSTGGTGGTGGGSGGGGTAGQFPGTNASTKDIYFWMASRAHDGGIPPILPVMANQIEQGGAPRLDSSGDGDNGLAIGYFQIHYDIHDLNGQGMGSKDFWRDPNHQIDWFIQEAKNGVGQYVGADKTKLDWNLNSLQLSDWIHRHVEHPADQSQSGGLYTHYQSGYSPALKILQTWVPGAGTEPQSPGNVPTNGEYVNLFKLVKNLNPERTDQGVDYACEPGVQLLAIGNMRYIGTLNNWFKGQPFIWFELLDGSLKGRFVYYSEGITPRPDMIPGSTIIKAGDVVCTTTTQPTGMEFGFAQADGTVLTPYGKNGEPVEAATSGGQRFARFLKTLGVPVKEDPGPGPI
jgi:hypothetical protein